MPPSAVPAVIVTPTVAREQPREIEGTAKAASGLMPPHEKSRKFKTRLGDCVCVGTRFRCFNAGLLGGAVSFISIRVRFLPVGPGVRAALMEEDSAAVHAGSVAGRPGCEAVIRRIAMLSVVRIVRIVGADWIVITYQRFMRL